MDIKNIEQPTQDNRFVEFLAPIKESFRNNVKEFMIRGIAINETTTRNGVTYEAGELEAGVNSLIGKPLLKDHTNSIDAIVGTVKTARFNNDAKAIEFEAQIMEESIKEKIDDGRIKSVSVGAFVNEVETDEEAGTVVAKGIDFVELSLVAVPADPKAGLTKALAEKFSFKNNLNASKGDKIMKTKERAEDTPAEAETPEPTETPEAPEEATETETEAETPAKETEPEAPAEEPEAPKEPEAEADAEVKEEKMELKETLKTLKAELKELKSDVTKTKEAYGKGRVDSETIAKVEAEYADYVVEKADNGKFAIYRTYESLPEGSPLRPRGR